MRTLYEKYIEVCVLWSPYRSLHSNAFAQFDPTNSAAWIKYAELETQLADFARVRAIFELGVSQTALSMPELLWKAYIDFETEEGEREKARDLYERLVQLSGHVKVWISYATFEAEPIPIARALREEAEDEEEEDIEEMDQPLHDQPPSPLNDPHEEFEGPPEEERPGLTRQTLKETL